VSTEEINLWPLNTRDFTAEAQNWHQFKAITAHIYNFKVFGSEVGYISLTEDQNYLKNCLAIAICQAQDFSNETNYE
jgi:hypothetical protein